MNGGGLTVAAGEDMQQNWQTVTLGADVPNVPARMACTEGDDNLLSVHLKFRAPNGKVYMVSACVDLSVLTEEMLSDARAKMNPGELQAVSGGRIGKKIRAKLRNAAKAVAHSKLVKTVVKTARKALNNPLVQAALSAVPGGAAALAVRNAARIAVRAAKGAKQAKKTIKHVMAGLDQNDPESLQAARLLNRGIRQAGMVPMTTLQAVSGRAGGSERAFLYAVLGQCVTGNYEVISGADNYIMTTGCGADDDAHDQEAFEEFATSGAWEGMRYLAQRLGLHSMLSDPNAFGKRDALLLGQQAQAAFASR